VLVVNLHSQVVLLLEIPLVVKVDMVEVVLVLQFVVMLSMVEAVEEV
tara:strand:- start:345 stop:485 length:141 start_codon:yes stop_codon:yes gene_type:complete